MNMSKESELFEKIKQIRAVAQIGLVYSSNEYDIGRYNELLEISNFMTSVITDVDISKISKYFKIETDYVTPKVDVRAVIFNEQSEILLVKEKADSKWSLPGGWADIGYSPTEVAIKEVLEETGLKALPIRLLAVLDKKCHQYPPALHYAYKLFILCEVQAGNLRTAFDILDIGYFKQNDIPPLSEERVIKEHIDLMFEYKDNPHKETIID
jgi:ADP-ribose pyrophosphatase YjhB (NUDIX family)